VTKRYVDANVNITANGVNEVGHQHVFTITTNAIPSGTAATLNSIVPHVTPAPNGTYSDTCATPQVNGNSATCTVTVNNNTAGTITATADASWHFVDSDPGATPAAVNVARSTNGTHGSSGSVVKRFVDANVSITPLSDVNEVKHQHTFTITTNAFPAGTTPQLTSILPTVSPAPTTLSTSCGTPVLSNGGNTATCTVTINSDSAGTYTANATANWHFTDPDPNSVPATADVSRSTAGNSGPGGSAGGTKRYVDAYITINPPEATNSVGQAHTVTVNVFQDNGNHAPGAPVWEPAPNGTIVNVTLTPDPSDPGATAIIIPPGDKCATVGTSLGACDVTFTSPTAGTIIAHAAVTFLVGGESLHRETDGAAPNSGNAIKHFKAGSIAWTKVDNAGRPLGGASFELCQTHTYNIGTASFDDIPDDCRPVVDNGQNDEDPLAGSFKVSGLQLGRYTVRETQAPPGYVLDPNTRTVELTPGSTIGVIQQPFVDNRPVVKITGFGYDNAPDGDPALQPDGIVKGTTTYTVKLHNYGTAAANLSNSSLTVTGPATCDGGNTLAITGTIPVGGNGGPYTLTCHYDHPAAPGEIRARLVVKTTTNGLERNASGSPAEILFTVNPT